MHDFCSIFLLTQPDAQHPRKSAFELETASKWCFRPGTHLGLNSPGQQEPGSRNFGGHLVSNGYQSAIDFWEDTAVAPQQSPGPGAATRCGTQLCQSREQRPHFHQYLYNTNVYCTCIVRQPGLRQDIYHSKIKLGRPCVLPT